MIKIDSNVKKTSKGDVVEITLNVKGSRFDLINEFCAILESMHRNHPEVLLAAVKLHMNDYFDVEREGDDD